MSQETARQKEARAQGKIAIALLTRGLNEQETQLINTMSEENIKKLFDSWFQKDTAETPADSFIVGVVFQHRNSACIPQWFSDNFRDMVWKPSKERTIKIDRTSRKVNEYRLPKNMNDSTIQKNAKSTPMSIEEYWLVRYLFIINPELGKQVLEYELSKSNYYIMHVRLDDGSVVAVGLRWGGDEWDSDAGRFDDDGDWVEGRIFLSFATA